MEQYFGLVEKENGIANLVKINSHEIAELKGVSAEVVANAFGLAGFQLLELTDAKTEFVCNGPMRGTVKHFVDLSLFGPNAD